MGKWESEKERLKENKKWQPRVAVAEEELIGSSIFFIFEH